MCPSGRHQINPSQLTLKCSASAKAEYRNAAVQQGDALRQRSAAESLGLREVEVTQMIRAQRAIWGLIHILGTERVEEIKKEHSEAAWE